MCAYVVPLRDGRLNAKHWLGGRGKLSAMQTDFAQAVGQRFGLRRGIKGSKAHHTKVSQSYAAINAPEPDVPQVEVSTPPVFGRGNWAKAEGDRIAAALQPVLRNAANAVKWGRLQDKKRREAQATAKQQADKAALAQAEVNKLQVANRRLRVALAEWSSVYKDGLTEDQAEKLTAVADRLREANRLAAGAANAPAEDSPQDEGQTVDVEHRRKGDSPTPGAGAENCDPVSHPANAIFCHRICHPKKIRR